MVAFKPCTICSIAMLDRKPKRHLGLSWCSRILLLKGIRSVHSLFLDGRSIRYCGQAVWDWIARGSRRWGELWSIKLKTLPGTFLISLPQNLKEETQREIAESTTSQSCLLLSTSTPKLAHLLTRIYIQVLASFHQTPVSHTSPHNGHPTHRQVNSWRESRMTSLSKPQSCGETSSTSCKSLDVSWRILFIGMWALSEYFFLK